jgi:hypothetical protein
MTREARPAGQWAAAEFGVHQATSDGLDGVDGHYGVDGPMPPYIRRPHDEVLRALLDPAVPGSRLIVLRGDSCTGRSRAVYEALADRLPGWPVRHPVTAAELAAGIPERTVLWLGELRRHVDAGDGAALLGHLADLVDGEGHLVIATVWPQDWEAYTTAAGTGRSAGDPARLAGRLLGRLPEADEQTLESIEPGWGGVIDVPARFTAQELAAAAGTDDPRLAAAAAAGEEVTQYLAGVPGLLERYADPDGRAVIAAAMDATRFGHAGPLTAALLRDAAGAEADGAAGALEPVAGAGAGAAGYRLVDYLDQYGRRTRQDQAGSPALWDALAGHADETGTGDLNRLARSARNRGLYRHAAALWTSAAARGSTRAATRLAAHLDRDDAARAAAWAAARVRLDDPWEVTRLLEALAAAAAGDAIRILLARDPGGQASLDHRWDTLGLLGALAAAEAAGRAGARDGTEAGDAVQTLAARLVERTRADDVPFAVSLMKALAAAGADDAARTLAGRVADQVVEVGLDELDDVALLLEAMPVAGAGEAAAALAARAADGASLENPQDVARLLKALAAAGAGDAARALLARDPAGQVSLDSVWDIADLLGVLRASGADRAVDTLAARVAAQASLDDAESLARLLDALRAAGARDAIGTLLARDPAHHADLWDTWGAGCLIGALHAAGAEEAAGVLAARVADDGMLDIPEPATWVLRALRAAGAADVIQTLAGRAAERAEFCCPLDIAGLLDELDAAGAAGAVRTLLDRDPGGQADPDDPGDIALLLGALRAAGAAAAARSLAARQTRLDDPQAVAGLLEEFRAGGAGDAAQVLLDRDPGGQVSLVPEQRQGVARLLAALRAAGAGDAAQVLAARAADAGMFDLAGDGTSYPFGREPDGAPSAPWRWTEPRPE